MILYWLGKNTAIMLYLNPLTTHLLVLLDQDASNRKSEMATLLKVYYAEAKHCDFCMPITTDYATNTRFCFTLFFSSARNKCRSVGQKDNAMIGKGMIPHWGEMDGSLKGPICREAVLSASRYELGEKTRKVLIFIKEKKHALECYCTWENKALWAVDVWHWQTIFK